MEKEFRWIGKGVYTLTEIKKLTGIHPGKIRRWTVGYSYPYKGEFRYASPIIAVDTERINGVPMFSFADLIEVRFLQAFRVHGVKQKVIRIAAEKAQELIGKSHPFSSRTFKTDGKTILAEIIKSSDDKVLLDLIKDQYAFERILGPSLYFGLEFNECNEPERWWPLGEDRSVVIDPQRAFGKPIITRVGIPTIILYKAVKGNGSIDLVSSWYEVEQKEIYDAIEFEEKLAA